MIETPTPDRKATVLLLLVIAGCVDAVGLTELGRYFVSYMSGNTTQIGLLLARRDYAAALIPLGLVALFVGGATAGTLVAEKTGRAAVGTLLLIEAALLGLAVAALGSPRPMLGIVALPVGMGLSNIVTLRNRGSHPGATYATGTLVGLGIGLAGLGRDADPRDVAFRAALWLALLLGSIGGAIGLMRFGADILLAPVAVLALLGMVALFGSRRR